MFVILYDITWGYDVFEAVALSYLATLLSFPTNDQNSAIFFSHLSHR